MELDDYEVHANNIEDEKDNENQNDEGPRRPGKQEALNKGKAVGGRDRVLKYGYAEEGFADEAHLFWLARTATKLAKTDGAAAVSFLQSWLNTSSQGSSAIKMRQQEEKKRGEK